MIANSTTEKIVEMVAECIIHEDTDSLLGLSLAGMSDANLTSSAGQCYQTYVSLPETIIFGIYALFALIFGVGGNMIVILATLKYTVFSLDSITMVFVRHLAIADILYIVIRVFPSITVHFARGWVMGKVLCFLSANTVTISTIASMHFILTVSIHRLLRCLFPLRFSLSVRNKATILALILWGYSAICSVISLSLNIEIYFRPSIAACDIDYSRHKSLAVSGVMVQMLIPFAGIVLINIGMYIIARHRFKDLSNNQALMTVASVAGLFVVSWLPSILVILLGVHGISAKSLIWLDKVQIHFYILSVFGNPFLYSFVHKGFGKFARSKFSIFVNKCHNSVEARWDNSISKSSDHTPGGEEIGVVPKCQGRRGSKQNIGMKRAGSSDLINEPLKDIAIMENDKAKCSKDCSEENSKDSGLCSAS